MHDNTLHYFEQQRQLLLDGLEAFRRRHPHQAQLLGISGKTITDPQLRALLDGVAYLTGLTAQQLALTAPQLTETLVRTVFVQVSADPLQPRDHWQPGGEYHHYLGQFIRTFFRRPLTFSVIFRTDDTRMMPVQLAAMTSRLGRNTRL